MRHLSLSFTLSLITIFSALYAAPKSKPNILFIFADDWGRHASIYKDLEGSGTVNDVIKTPNFDQLAKEGVLFKQAYVSAPSCTPCRSSILSGMHFWQTGSASVLCSTWDFNLPAYPLIMEENGYSIGYSYKVWSPGSPRNAPHGGSRAMYNKAGSKMNGFSFQVTNKMNKGMDVEKAKNEILKEVKQNFEEFLEKNGTDKPFCYWYGPTNVHRKWQKGSGKAIWGMDPDRLKGLMPPFLPDEHDVRQDLNDYLGEVQAFDASIGVLIKKLKKEGLYKNTLIAISGDHGAPGFPHGKCNLYDFGSRVPLLVLGPGVKGGRVVDDFVSLPDLAPTFLQTANIDIPEAMSAKSLWPVLKSNNEGQVDPTRSQVYTGLERHFPTARTQGKTYPKRAIRTSDYLLIKNFKPGRDPMGEYFGLENGKTPSFSELEKNTAATIRDEDAGP
ncbi:MAG: sulfatase, partial [Planctomycetes bacterium]|nr:sulfatase [Planctomycetota bacterium]